MIQCNQELEQEIAHSGLRSDPDKLMQDFMGTIKMVGFGMGAINLEGRGDVGNGGKGSIQLMSIYVINILYGVIDCLQIIIMVIFLICSNKEMQSNETAFWG